ncbi:MAG TPA: hypothetical protein VJ576_13230 [Rhodocyclaceae bacterium]|nr:hypothetical protein [Rhodocyclaceae bacterium]
MRQGWFKRNFGWIGDDFRRLVARLKQGDTWILIGMAGLFGVLAYFSFVFALRMDFMMKLRHLSESACREIENGATALLFFGTAFFALTIVLVFGEFARHLDYKRRNAHAQARSAARQCIGWGAFAITIGVAMMVFLQSMCA